MSAEGTIDGRAIDGGDWSVIEPGLIERAHRLERLLADIYGPRQLVPPEMVLGHARFLRACVDWPGERLSLVAVDLVRAPDGWRVWADWTDAPAGLGRVPASALAPLRVRLGANAAVLAAGAHSWSWADQTALAQSLGLPLVPGEDLAVRGGQIWLDLLGGSERLDALLRLIDDDYADPLELRSDSLLGVAGLTRAARSGGVRLCNGLGSAILETAGVRERVGGPLPLADGHGPLYRAFLVAPCPGAWVVLPGLLDDDQRWIPAPSAAVKEVETTVHRLPAPRRSSELPSRLADHLFWFGRYAERGDLPALRRNAESLRDRLPEPVWQTLERLDDDAPHQALLALQGAIDEWMMRDLAWRFLDLGRRIERGIAIAGALQEGFSTAELRLGIADARNPRGLRFQLDAIRDDCLALAELPGGATVARFAEIAWLRLENAPASRQLLSHVGGDLALLSELITANFFRRALAASW